MKGSIVLEVFTIGVGVVFVIYLYAKLFKWVVGDD